MALAITRTKSFTFPGSKRYPFTPSRISSEKPNKLPVGGINLVHT